MLTIYSQSPGKRRKNKHKEFATVQEAVQYGQNSGKLYSIFDAKSHRIIDWTEINENSNDDWVYNEQEQVWEKSKDEDSEEQQSFPDMNKYDRLFLKQARLGYSNFLHRYRRTSQDLDLRERKNLLNEEFVFSDENVKRLSVINSLLAEKSEAAYQLAEKFENDLILEMQKPDTFISDYEIQFKVNLFSEKKYSTIPDLQDNPFFEYEPIWFAKANTWNESDIKWHKDWLFKMDHTEVMEGHALYSFSYCYIFHDLIYHTILSYQDIVDIEDIWIEVIFRIQNFQAVNPKN